MMNNKLFFMLCKYMPFLNNQFKKKHYLCRSMKTKYKKWIRLIMLASGFILLLTVVIPHHHHEDGTPCICAACDDEGDEHHNCDAGGHTLAFDPPQVYASETGDPARLLMPLYTFLEYTCPPLLAPLFSCTVFYRDTGHVPLRDIWIQAAMGLRAPPAC
jgi:hypothetical protein